MFEFWLYTQTTTTTHTHIRSISQKKILRVKKTFTFLYVFEIKLFFCTFLLLPTKIF